VTANERTTTANYAFETLEVDVDFVGTSASNEADHGTAISYAVTGPGTLHLTVADITWDNGERDLRAIHRHNSPQRFDRLLHGGRLIVNDHEGITGKRIDLRQMRMKDATWSNLKRATLLELDQAADCSTSETLRGFGATKIGTREDVLGDTSPHRGSICCTFPSDATDVPIAAYLITRVAPLHRKIQA
jgi:hypothetical protein